MRHTHATARRNRVQNLLGLGRVEQPSREVAACVNIIIIFGSAALIFLLIVLNILEFTVTIDSFRALLCSLLLLIVFLILRRRKPLMLPLIPRWLGVACVLRLPYLAEVPSAALLHDPDRRLLHGCLRALFAFAVVDHRAAMGPKSRWREVAHQHLLLLQLGDGASLRVGHLEAAGRRDSV